MTLAFNVIPDVALSVTILSCVCCVRWVTTCSAAIARRRPAAAGWRWITQAFLSASWAATSPASSTPSTVTMWVHLLPESFALIHRSKISKEGYSCMELLGSSLMPAGLTVTHVLWLLLETFVACPTSLSPLVSRLLLFCPLSDGNKEITKKEH